MKVLTVLTVLLLIAMPMVASADEVSGEISPFGDAIHVEFQGRQNWDYNLKRDGKNITLVIPRVNAATIERFKTWSGPMIERVSVKDGDDNGHNITFQLKGDAVDTFDYLTDQPSRLVIDFFKKKDEKPAVAEAPKAAKPEVQAAKSLPQKLPAKKGRQPAGEILASKVDGPVKVAQAEGPVPLVDEQRFGIFDGGDPDFSRFEIKDHEVREDAIIASRQNFYLDFPMLELEPVSLKELWETPPIYEIKPEDNDENKKARLLYTLFNKNRPAVFLKTLEFFEKDYPKSKYNEIVKFMEADVYYDLWKKTQSPTDFSNAMTRYQTLVEEFPKSVLAERTSLLVGYSFRNRGDNLGALKTLQRYTKHFPASENVPRVKLAIADSYRSLKSFDDAIKTFDEVESDSKSGVYGVAAGYKRGDVYFDKGEFQNAVSEYQKAIKKYPKNTKEFPNAFYNLAESYFQLKKYREGLTAYGDFLNRFPRSAHGGFAMTRIGELLEILGADSKKINGAFLESIFRYKGSTGAGVARVRLIRERLPEMKAKEVETALEEIKSFAASTDLPKVNEYATIMTADGLSRRKDFRKSLGLLIDFYQGHPTGQLDIFKNRIVENIASEMRHQIGQDGFLEALKIHGEYASVWLKNSDRIDIDYYLGKSYEKSGLYDEAGQNYRKALNSLYAVKGTPKEREKQIMENLPQPEQVLLRLAAMSFNRGETAKTYEYLENLRDTSKLNSDEKIERVEIAAQLAIAKNQREPAKKYLQELVETWKGRPSKVAEPLFTIAGLDAKANNYRESNRALDRILQLQEDSGEIGAQLIFKTLQLKADNQVEMKDSDGAIATHKRLLEKYEETYPLESFRYRLGLLHFKKGNLVEAEKVWGSFKKDSVWGRLAKEQMSHSKWKENYKKYIERIPAMSDAKKPADKAGDKENQ
ncbi:MAG: tetratricopeptide repeat protein [Bdellovibrionia bacterium]